MQWTTGDASGGIGGFGGTGAQVGFDSGDGSNFISVMRPNSYEDLDTTLFDDGKKAGRKAHEELNTRLESLQEKLYAQGRHRLLVVLQATGTSVRWLGIAPAIPVFLRPPCEGGQDPGRIGAEPMHLPDGDEDLGLVDVLVVEGAEQVFEHRDIGVRIAQQAGAPAEEFEEARQ